jgi:hypothetical protein
VRWLELRRVGIGVAVAVAFTAAGCAKTGQTGVSVKGVDANLVFGTKPAPNTAAPANTLTDQGLSPDYANGGIALPSQSFTTTKKTLHTAPSLPRTPCPDANVNAFPSESAPLDVPNDRRPTVGSYRWKRSGNETVKNIKLPVSGFEQHYVRNIKELGKSTNTQQVPGSAAGPGVIFSYETVQPDANGNVVVTTWQVDTSAAQQTVQEGLNTPVVNQGNPERGLAIKRIDVFDTENNLRSSFAPITGLLMLPLPVQEGLQFQSVAIDPSTGEEATFNGQVLPRQDIDACGELVEGWKVTGTQTFSNSATTRTEELVVATQLGGMVISDKVHQSDSTGANVIDTLISIGQTRPDPLPAS